MVTSELPKLLSRVRTPAAVLIGFIGIGTMGAGMVRNLAKHGHQVLAYNRTRTKAEELASERITASELDDLARATIIITCLSNDQALEETLFASGFLKQLNDCTLIDCGTTSPEMTMRIADACSAKNIRFLDAPITGSKMGADNGTLVFMVGGERAAFDSALPILKAMGTRHVHCGPTGYGQKAKIALNLTQALVLESYLEGMALGIKNGVPLAAMQEILDNSGAKSGVSTAKMPQILARDFKQRFKLRLMHKDLMLAQKEMQKLNADLPLAELIADIYAKGLEHGDEDISSTVKTIEDANGVKLT